MKKLILVFICLLSLANNGCSADSKFENAEIKYLPTESEEKILFDLNSKTVTLNNGHKMPVFGLGTYSLHGETCKNSIKAALENGVRLFDTAHAYENEVEVGAAIRESNIPREEIFVITKLYPNQFDDPEAAIEETLQKLNLGYIDMMLLHHPGKNDVEVYKTIEKYISAGKIRSVGLSNWYIEELKNFLPKVNIKPALIQNEIHPYYQEIDVVPFIQSLGITVQGWYPLGGRGFNKELLADSVLSEIAKKHNKSLVQVILRWNLQRNIVVIPGSSNPAHIKENTEIFDFELSADEMEQIKNLNRNEKHDWY
jgi:diketogulonate reductase-like aldo/keto reductase